MYLQLFTAFMIRLRSRDGTAKQNGQCATIGCAPASASFINLFYQPAKHWSDVRVAAMKVVLASESPFRRRALDMLGLTYETCPSGIDERAIRAEDAGDLTRKLAEAKAWEVASRYEDAIVVS